MRINSSCYITLSKINTHFNLRSGLTLKIEKMLTTNINTNEQ